MRISHRHRFVFFARPKTGSSSVRQFLDPWADVHPVKNYTERVPDNPFYPHMRPVEAREHFRDRAWDFEGYTKFTCARNPWARLVSLYRHVREASPELVEFKHWVHSISPDGLGGGGEHWQRWRRYGAYSLGAYVNDEHCAPLVDAVLRMEHLETDLKPFLATLSLPDLADRPIPHSNNRSKGESYVQYYDSAARELVSEQHAEEIERFGYRFGE